MRCAIGSDHAGVQLKAIIQDRINEIEFIDVGTHTEESVDYPDYIAKVGKLVQQNEADFGIVICGSGAGASIVANKIKGIRAVLCCNEYMAEMARKHNNANILSLGSRILGEDLAMAIIERWISTDFEGGRHQRRVDKITSLEEEELV